MIVLKRRKSVCRGTKEHLNKVEIDCHFKTMRVKMLTKPFLAHWRDFFLFFFLLKSFPTKQFCGNPLPLGSNCWAGWTYLKVKSKKVPPLEAWKINCANMATNDLLEMWMHVEGTIPRSPINFPESQFLNHTGSIPVSSFNPFSWFRQIVWKPRKI